MENERFEISGHIVDVVRGIIFDGIICVCNGKITAIEASDQVEDQYITPGLIDAHIHIESSMLLPTAFAQAALPHGTLGCICDPHEIANVLGVEGIRYLIEDGKRSPLKFFFGLPSCVPATPFEKAGAVIDEAQTRILMQAPDIWFLAEMMNYPGVLAQDKEVMQKIEAAKTAGKPIDGHAPLLSGQSLKAYGNAGITTDHECTTLCEAKEKIESGFSILIRDGSCTQSSDELLPLLKESPEKVMFCSDDRHPHDLIKDHIDGVVRKALQAGYDPIAVLRAASYNPVRHYKIPVGLLQKDDPADFIVVNSLQEFILKYSYIGGKQVYANGKLGIDPVQPPLLINNFKRTEISPKMLQVRASGSKMRVIGLTENELLTQETFQEVVSSNTPLIEANPEEDLLKIVVCNRYEAQSSLHPAFLRGLGLKRGAIATSISHDSHNIVAAGCNDADLASAINLVIKQGGGIAVAHGESQNLLPLPIAGIISTENAEKVAQDFEQLLFHAHRLGSPLPDPFMTLSFMTLLVIPNLKIADFGLFDVNRFTPVPLFID